MSKGKTKGEEPTAEALDAQLDSFNALQDLGGDLGGKEDVDGRSVFVSNVDYDTETTELVKLFGDEVGTVNRVTILCDKFGNSKGVAYVEFDSEEIVQKAIQKDSQLSHRGRTLGISAKRTNIPGRTTQRGRGGRGRSGGRGGDEGGRGGPVRGRAGRFGGRGFQPYGGGGGRGPRGRGRGPAGGGGGMMNAMNPMMLNMMAAMAGGMFGGGYQGGYEGEEEY
eukprot:TRINITY_DN27683_c0_g1_i2.p1 TRINITY_DN27683_c0_g1~~TRINITY_DN27683_c0_g1_i2.p1  ORF type:complete len:236 (-),score=24.28 TRINITY_DN27683_c0_g1_i2:405-1073(-)